MAMSGRQMRYLFAIGYFRKAKTGRIIRAGKAQRSAIREQAKAPKSKNRTGVKKIRGVVAKSKATRGKSTKAKR